MVDWMLLITLDGELIMTNTDRGCTINKVDKLCEVCEHDPLNQSTRILDDSYWTKNGFCVCKDCFNKYDDRGIAEQIALNKEILFRHTTDSLADKEQILKNICDSAVQNTINKQWLMYAECISEDGAIEMLKVLRSTTDLVFTTWKVRRVLCPSTLRDYELIDYMWELWLFNDLNIKLKG